MFLRLLILSKKFAIKKQLKYLGIAYYCQGDYVKAIESYQNSLSIIRKMQDKKAHEKIMIYLGMVYCALGDYGKAIAYNQEHLVIVQATLQQLKRSLYLE